MLLSPTLGASEETLRTLEDSLTEQGVTTTVLLGDNAPDEYLNQDESVVQVIIVTVGPGEAVGQVEGSLTWSGSQLDLLEGEQRREGEEILETVRRVVEETRRVEEETKSVAVPKQEDSGAIEEVLDVGVPEESRPARPPVTVVVSLKTESESLGSRLQPEELGQRMKSQLPTVEGVVVLLNAPTEYIQAQLGSVASVGGAAVLLDLRVIGQDNAVSGNIYRNFVPLEQLEGEEYDDTLLILLAVNKEVEQAIEGALQEVEVADFTEEEVVNSPRLEEVGGEFEEARVTEFLEEEEEEEGEEVNEDEQLLSFDPTASQDYSFEAGSIQDYDVVGGSDQDYSLGAVADGQDYSLSASGVSSQDYTLSDGGVSRSQDYTLGAGSVSSSQDYSLESEDPSVLTSSFLLEDPNQNSNGEDALLTSDYFGWDEHPTTSIEDPAPGQVDQMVQLSVPQAVLNIGEAVEDEEEDGDVPVAEPEPDHVADGEHAVGGHQGIARPDFEDPAILVGGPVTPAQDLGQIQEVGTSY